MNLNKYQIVAIVTILATLFLILVGGLVRASGAGLGCPDWPKCYGLWIPPLNVADLPAQYDPLEFNALKTWTEYVNRLIGVLIGLLITATFVLSFRYRKSKPSVTVASGLAFLLVIFQGWLGGMVVRSGLSEGIITLHMITAMVIVGMLIFAAFKAFSGQIGIQIRESNKRTLLLSTGLLLFFTLLQMVFGTQVREAIDVISRGTEIIPRVDWINYVGIIDDIHRSFSWSILITSAFLSWYIHKNQIVGYFRTLNLWVAIMILSQIVIGVVLAYFGMPASFQVLHLFGSAVLVSLILLQYFSIRDARVI